MSVRRHHLQCSAADRHLDMPTALCQVSYPYLVIQASCDATAIHVLGCEARSMPEEAPLEAPLEDAGCLGATLVGVSDLLPNSEPTALSKKPAEAGFEDTVRLGAAFEGATGLVANSEPTALSKKPLEVPAPHWLITY